jgi:hypothetical protein
LKVEGLIRAVDTIFNKQDLVFDIDTLTVLDEGLRCIESV